MTPLLLLDNLVQILRDNFKGYSLLSKSGTLQEIKIFPQYIPQPAAITISTPKRGTANYSESDYEANFPCIVAKIIDVRDNEEGSLNQSRANVKLITGIYDINPECQGYRDILNIQEKLRDLLLTHRIIGKRFMLNMPVLSKILDSDTWPVYYGETELFFDIGRPQQPDYYYHQRRL